MEDIEKVVISVQKGDSELFEIIVGAFQKQLFYYIHSIVGNVQDAEDLLQDTFFTSFKKINKYQKDKSFLAWLYKIARNKSINHLKKSKRIQINDLEEINNLQQENELMKIHDGYHEMVDYTLRKLNIKEREIILLHLVEERDYQELAELLCKKQSTLRKRFERASKKFQQIYNDFNQEDDYGHDATGYKKVF